MNVTILENVNNIEEWNNFLNSQCNGNYFQSSHYIQLISGLPGHQPMQLFAYQNDQLVGLLCGVIQKEGKGLKGYLKSILGMYSSSLRRRKKIL